MNTSNGPARTSPDNRPASPGARIAGWAGGAMFVASLAYFLYAYLVVFGRPAPAGAWLPAAAINVTLFTLFALHHSLFARTPLKARVRKLADPRLERSLYVWMASLLFLGVCLLWRPVPGELYRLEGPWWWLGVTVQVIGLALTYLGSRALDALDLAGIRQLRQDAAAHPRLVTSGVYAVVRHPLYFGWALLVFGAPHMTMTRAVFAVVSTLYLAVAIPFEERSLTTTFGAAYEAYTRRVRWRMLPFLY
jgi:methanethiol S-methyltransferase